MPQPGPLRLIAVSFLSVAPPGIPQVLRSRFRQAAHFGTWRSTGAGSTPMRGNHLNCPIGSYTHAIDLPADARPRARTDVIADGQTSDTCDWRTFPRFRGCPQTAGVHLLCAARADDQVPPDVVIAAGQPGPLMRLQEAAVPEPAPPPTLPLLARLTCMALPAAMAHGSVMSTGCIGNRVYTGLGDDELYLMIPGTAAWRRSSGN